MKIAYITPYYNGVIDGRYGRFLDCIHYLRDSEEPLYEFDVFAFSASNPDNTLTSNPGQYFGNASLLWDRKINKLEYALNIPRIWRDLRLKEYDLIHVTRIDLMTYPTAWLGHDVPIVIGPDIGGWTKNRLGKFHNAGYVPKIKQRTKYIIKKIMAQNVLYNKVIALSTYHKGLLMQMGFAESCIDIIAPGVDPMFHAHDVKRGDVPELLFVGDFSEHKGYKDFLRALTHLDRDFTARVIGSGDPREPMINTLGLSGNVVIEGFINRMQLAEKYRAADLFVVPSIDEWGGPSTQVEALACGTPVVATDRPGLNEYAPEGTAVYFWPREPSTLADAIERALSDIKSMTDAAMRHSPEFNVRRTIDDLHSLYTAVLDEGVAKN